MAVFKNPAMPSVVSQTDAMIKLASAEEGFAGTDVFWEQVGFPEDTRRRVVSQVKDNQASTLVTQALLGTNNASE